MILRPQQISAVQPENRFAVFAASQAMKRFSASSDTTDDSDLQIICSALASVGVMPDEILAELEGGASTRRFFRVRYAGGSAILMYTPAPSQEIAKARQSAGYGPFVEVAELLRSHDIPVPQILRSIEGTPVLLVEDLGDSTLAHYLTQRPQSRCSLYQQAVSRLAHAQRELIQLPEDSVIKKRAFDYELLLWEVDHFRKWALLERGYCLSAEEERVFSDCCHYLASEIASWPRQFVHRDYQSRNLMVRGAPGDEQLVWIDFQDAMMGPRVYDLVALLTDSYQTFSQDFIDSRLREYSEAVGAVDQQERIFHEFSLVTVQRKLKDAGRFVFLDRVNKNPHFLQFVDSTIVRARSALRQVRHLGPLLALDQLLEEHFGPLTPGD